MPDWHEIVERDGRAAWRTAYRLLGNRADADECFQEACLAAVTYARREEVRDWRALLQRLAAVRAVDCLRRRQRRLVRALPDADALPGATPGPEQAAEDAELADRLRAALALLPARHAEVFCLCALEDWSYQDAARHLAVSVDAVGVMLYRARARLRQLLDLRPAAQAPQTGSEPREEPS